MIPPSHHTWCREGTQDGGCSWSQLSACCSCCLLFTGNTSYSSLQPLALPSQETVLHECLQLTYGSAARISSPSTEPAHHQSSSKSRPLSGFLGLFWLSAMWGFLWLSAAQLFSHHHSLRIAGFQPASLPWAKGKWVYWRVTATSSSIPWVTACLLLLPPYRLQSKRALQNQKAFPYLKSFIC